MTAKQVIEAWLAQRDVHAQTASLSSVGATGRHGPGRALLSDGVPIAFVTAEGQVYIDTFSEWSLTTTMHQHAACRAAKESGCHVHGANFPMMQRISGINVQRTPAIRRQRIDVGS